MFLHEASRSLVVEELSFVSIPNAAVLQVADAHDRALILGGKHGERIAVQGRLGELARLREPRQA